jgi:hypothetical protein
LLDVLLALLDLHRGLDLFCFRPHHTVPMLNDRQAERTFSVSIYWWREWPTPASEGGIG